MVPVELDGFNVCSLSGDNTWAILDEVTTDCNAGPFGFIFLWANGADNAGEGDGPALGHLVFVNEEDCVGAFDSVSDALG